jgi:prepilin-type N-terminal cleavage/methylation domain-containing protein
MLRPLGRAGFSLVEVLVVAALTALLAASLLYLARSGVLGGRARLAQLAAQEVVRVVSAWGSSAPGLSVADAVQAWGTDCRYQGVHQVSSPLGGTFQVAVPDWVESCTLSFGAVPWEVRASVVYGGRTYTAGTY